MLARGLRDWANGHGRAPGWLQAWASRKPPLPGFEPDDLFVLGIVYAVSGVLLGVAVAQDEAGAALYHVVAKGFWLAGFFVGAALMVAGLLARWQRAMWLGNGILAAAYSSMAVGLVATALDRWPVYLALFVPFAVMHWYIWARVGWREPPAQDHEGGLE